MPTKTKQAPRESIAVLLTVIYDLDQSTPFAEVYRASSDTTIGLTYKVVYEPRRGLWTCECLGFQHHGRCRHQRRADRLRRVRFFSALYAGQPAPVLRAHLAHHQGRVDAGMADADDLAALDFIAIELGEERAA